VQRYNNGMDISDNFQVLGIYSKSSRKAVQREMTALNVKLLSEVFRTSCFTVLFTRIYVIC